MGDCLDSRNPDGFGLEGLWEGDLSLNHGFEEPISGFLGDRLAYAKGDENDEQPGPLMRALMVMGERFLVVRLSDLI